MQNVGTWNSDLALIFFGMFMLPIVMYFCAGLFFRCRTVYVTQPPEIVYKDSPPKIIYKTSPAKTVYKKSPPKIIYRDRPKKKKSKKEALPESPLTSSKMQQDGIDSLVALGTKKMQARKTIQSLCATKCYNSLDSLIRDAFPHKM